MQEDYKVGERIKQIRENLNMNREKFSEMIDISSVLQVLLLIIFYLVMTIQIQQ